jgi:hypothetical protein
VSKQMKFELELNLDVFHKETARCLGVVFTEEFIRRFLTKKQTLLGYLAGEVSYSFDTYERDWLMDELSDELIGMTFPLNMDSDEYTEQFKIKWLAYISDSDDIDHEKSREYLDDGTN